MKTIDEKTIVIEADKRYILIVTYPDDITKSNLDELEVLSEKIEEWWRIGGKFLLLYKRGNMKIQFEKVEDGKEEKI